jgi:flagellar basal body-associated protein FliL
MAEEIKAKEETKTTEGIKKKSNTGKIILIVLAVILVIILLCGAGGFFLIRNFVTDNSEQAEEIWQEVEQEIEFDEDITY